MYVYGRECRTCDGSNIVMNPRRVTARVKLLVLCIAAASLLQCAFINTFYNARRAFNVARTEHRRQMRQFPDTLLAPTGDALSNYDRTIAKCYKLLDVYRKRKRWHDESIYYAGMAYYYKLEMSSAIRQFRRLQVEWPGSEYVPQSYLFLARAFLYDERYDKAEETLRLVLEKYPELNAEDEVSLLQAKLALRREGKGQAIEMLELVRNSVRSNERKIELTIQMAALYMDLGRYDKAVDVLRDCPRQRKAPLLMYRVDDALLRSLIALDSAEAALALVDRMLEAKGYQDHDADILLNRADILVSQGAYDDAIAVCERVAQRWPDTRQASLAWYKLGEIYFRHKADYEQARECYEKSTASKEVDSTIVEQARRFGKALADLDTLKDHWDTPHDSADSAMSDADFHLAAGELFWLELKQADSAYTRYSAMLQDTAADDELRAKALFASGYICLHGLHDTAAAESLFATLVQTYPASEFSKRSQIERGMRVTVRTREDSALAALRRAEELYYEEDDVVNAVENYLRVYQLYPDCEVAPKSLYAAAWLWDNVTFNKEGAQFLYKKVCDKFPDSPYCTEAAKPRLKSAMDSTLIKRERTRRQETESPEG